MATLEDTLRNIQEGNFAKDILRIDAGGSEGISFNADGSIQRGIPMSSFPQAPAELFEPSVFIPYQPSDIPATEATIQRAVRPPNTDMWGKLPTQAEAPNQAQIQPDAKLQSTTSLLNPLQDAMLKASTAKTPDELLSATQDLLGQQAAYEAKKNEDALTAAAQKVGLPRLEQRLQSEILADQNDPKYTGYDSKITSEVRSQLAQAKAESRIIANQLIASDPELARLKVETNFMANEAATRAIKMRQRDEIETAKDSEKGLLISNKTVEALKHFYPGETLGMSRGTMFDFNKNNKDKEIQLVTNNADRPEALLELAVIKGSGRAKDFLVHQSAVEASGTDDTTNEAYLMAKDKTNLDLVELETLASRPEEAIKMAFGAAKSDEAKKFIGEFTVAVEAKTPSEKDEYKKLVGMKYAKQVIEQKKIAEFSLVSNWKASERAALQANPLTNDLMTRAASKKGGRVELVTLNDLVTETGLLEPAKRSEAFKAIVDSATKEAETRNKGLFGLNTTAYELKKRLEKDMIMADLGIESSGTLGDLLGRGLKQVGEVGRFVVAGSGTALGLAPATVKSVLETPLESYQQMPGNILREAQAFGARISGTGKYVPAPESFARIKETGEQK